MKFLQAAKAPSNPRGNWPGKPCDSRRLPPVLRREPQPVNSAHQESSAPNVNSACSVRSFSSANAKFMYSAEFTAKQSARRERCDRCCEPDPDGFLPGLNRRHSRPAAADPQPRGDPDRSPQPGRCAPAPGSSGSPVSDPPCARRKHCGCWCSDDADPGQRRRPARGADSSRRCPVRRRAAPRRRSRTGAARARSGCRR